MRVEQAKAYWQDTISFFYGKRDKVALAAGGISLSLLAACGPSTQPSSSATSESTPAASTSAGTGSSSAAESSSAAATTTGAAAKTFTLTPDLSYFLKPGTSDTCFNSGQRPCSVLVRVSPARDSEIINVPSPTSTAPVAWPKEAYGGAPADLLTGLCYDTAGGPVGSYEGNLHSTTWYAVRVPYDHIENPTIKQQIDAEYPHTPEDQKEAVGYVSALYVAEQQPPAGATTC